MPYTQVFLLRQVKDPEVPEWIGYVPDFQPYHLIISSASGSRSYNLMKLQISSIDKILLSKRKVLIDLVILGWPVTVWWCTKFQRPPGYPLGLLTGSLHGSQGAYFPQVGFLTCWLGFWLANLCLSHIVCCLRDSGLYYESVVIATNINYGIPDKIVYIFDQ